MRLEWTVDLRQRLQAAALGAGFDAADIAAATSEADPDGRFATWIESGYAGKMEFLKRRNEQGVLLRAAAQVAFPWAQSIVVCAMNYNAAAPRSIDAAPQGAGWIARYAWSGRSSPMGEEPVLPTDYHDDLLDRLRRIEVMLKEHAACETRCYVDTGPIVERDFAARAGIGWIGKNTCVLNQQLGSWLLLGVIITSLTVPDRMSIEVAADRCGSCTRCIDACPTDALIAPRQMDASRCIAYLTIELKGSIPEDLRDGMGRQVFGCDICQDVCPWNRKAPVAVKQGVVPRTELINPQLDWLAQMDAASFSQHFKGSPLERTRRKRIQRNVAIAMGNSLDVQYLAQLEMWAAGDDPVLSEAAGWAIAKIRSGNDGLPSGLNPDREGSASIG